jgi:hypothetical protein
MSARGVCIGGLFLLLSVALPRRAEATTVPLDNSWFFLDDYSDGGAPPLWFTGTASNFFGITGTASSSAAGATSYTWTSPNWVRFDITDWLVVGDAYDVYDFGALIASYSSKPDYTAIPGCTGNGISAACGWTDDPDAALVSPLFNNGSYFFAPGSHSLTIADVRLPTGYSDATVAFRATPVPEPPTLFLLGCGFLAAAVQLRRQQTRVELRAGRARR